MKLKTLLFLTGILTIGYFVCYATDKVIYDADTKKVKGIIVKQAPSAGDFSRIDYRTDKGLVYGATSKIQIVNKPLNLSMKSGKVYTISADKTQLIEMVAIEVAESTGTK